MAITLDGTTGIITPDLAVDTNTLFVDAANNRVGVGTASPATALDVTGTVTADDYYVNSGGHIEFDFNGVASPFTSTSSAYIFTGTGGSGTYLAGSLNLQSRQTENRNIQFITGTTPKIRATIGGTGDISFYEDTGTTPKFFWDASAQSLGIGTSSPVHSISLEQSNKIGWVSTVGSDKSAIEFSGVDDSLRFYNNTGNTERMRIDSSGNLLVGKTSADAGATAGMELRADNILRATRSGAPTAAFNRLSTDGTIVAFLKDGTTIGSIGVSSSGVNPFIGSGDVTIVFSSAGDTIVPAGTDGAARSGAIDLGNSSNRWDTVYATNGTINTSDRNEKQDIEELNDAERRVAVACKGLLRKYRLKSAVALKGEDARIHFGIIAQDLQDAFTAEGLDAGRYAMFIHSTWTDEETGEEKSLMGVRYSELLAFMIAAI